MTTAATSLLGLALPVTGELSGVWGQTVNDSITTLLDSAVAGTTTLSTDADVTLTTTTLAANQARQAILLCSGARTALRTITAPAQSKIYTIINATTGGFSVKLVGVGPTTGLTIPNGASAVVAWNGSDFIEIGSSTVGNLVVNGNLTVTGTTTLTGAATLTANPTLSAGTANGVAYLNGSKVVTTGSALTFDGTNLGINCTATPYAAGDRLLQINGGANPSEIRLTNNTASTTGALFQQAGNDLYIWNVANSFISFGVNATEGMRLTSTGLGIGTSSPGVKLDVVGPNNGDQIRFGNGRLYTFKTSAANTYDNSLLTLDSNSAVANYAWAISGSEKMRLDSSGNLGIGTSSPTVNLHVYNASSAETRIASANIGLQLYSSEGAGTSVIGTYTNHALVFRTNATERARIDSSGNLLIGTTSSDGSRLRVYGSYQTLGDGSYEGLIGKASSLVSGGGTGEFAIRSSSNLLFATNGNTERARIDTSGNLLVGTTSASGRRLWVAGSNTGYISTIQNDNSSPLGLQIYHPTDVNGTGNSFLVCVGNATNRVELRSNGGIGNYSANDVNLSDRREKTNFAPAKSYLDTICAIPVQTFNYIDQNLEEDAGLTLGVVAQDVQAVAPELVMESNWGTAEEPKMRLSIYQTDLQYALMKCIQEQQALITQLTARITALEAK